MNKAKKGKDKMKTNFIGKILKYTLCIIFAILFVKIMINLISNSDDMKYNVFIIVSESMEPNIKVGDIILEKKIKEEDLKKGDIITYKIDDQNITHRIVNIEIINNITYYKTKGDNNKIEDEKKIVYSDIRGKVIAKIPLVGNFILNKKIKKIILIILVICIIIYMRLKKIETKMKKRRMKKELEDERYFEKKKK